MFRTSLGSSGGGDGVTEERIERTRRIRKRIHESIPACVAVVDHGDYVGAYVYPDDVPAAEAAIAGSDWEGVTVHVRPTPPLSQ
jgi:hypothetical protein